MHRRPIHLLLFLGAALAAVWPASAQSPLTNAAVKGTYNVRYVGVIGYPNDYPISFAGTVTFDGNGNYTVNGTGVYNNGSSVPLTPTTSGTYSVLSSGEVALNNPFAVAPFTTTAGSVVLYGGVGNNGVLVLSSTESGYLDLFVGIPQASGASAGTLSGTYNVAGVEFVSGTVSSMSNVSFSATANGSGSLGNLALSGSSSALGDNTASQSISGASYTLTSNGTGTMILPTPSGVTTANQLIGGTKTLYVSSDGSFFVSGSPSGWDIQVGVKAVSSGGSSIFSGLYYDAAVENITGSNGYIDSWYGASDELSNQTELYHQRVNTDGYAGEAYDFTSTDTVTLTANGTASTPGYFLAVGANGNYAVSSGGEGDYYLIVWTKISTFSGTGVFLNPTAVVNAATNAPFTAQISPGEVITLYGTGFTSNSTPQTAQSLPFPNQLGGVQVNITDSADSISTQAPVYYVSPTQISCVVPYTLPGDGSLASIQVVSNGAQSNIVQTYTGLTSAGVFTVPSGGLGDAAILHANNTLVSSSSPAAQGETVQLFLTGLGAVSGNITAGSAAPSTQPFATTTYPVQIYIDDSLGNYTQATVTYQGLAPGLAGLYQVNFTVPTGLAANGAPFYVEVYMLQQADSDNLQAIIPISQ